MNEVKVTLINFAEFNFKKRRTLRSGNARSSSSSLGKRVRLFCESPSTMKPRRDFPGKVKFVLFRASWQCLKEMKRF